jgi:hypothetical protein
MKNQPLGCITTSGIVSAVLTALIVAGFAFFKGGMLFNPGALNAQTGAALGGASSHAEISTQCNLCHVPFWSVTTMADRCVVCHQNVAVQMLVPSPLHGVLRQINPNLTCHDCHPEHHGGDAPLTDMRAVKFPHNSVGYALTGHKTNTDGLPFDCDDCHAQGYTGFEQTICSTCHIQITPGFMQTHTQDYGSDCLACHDGLDSYGANFDHTGIAFELTGKHAQVACTQCHLKDRSLEDLQSTPQDCNSCHAEKDVHQGRLGSECGTCHTTDGWTPATFDHDLSTFKLTGKHAGVACDLCHIDHILQGTPSDCNSCHQKDDPHIGNLGPLCGACHTSDGWTPSTYDHNLSTFKLTGVHSTTACGNCHFDIFFHGTPADCNSCHHQDDTHNGQYGTSCWSCHTTSGWTPATFDHSLSTFKLTGQHVNVDCLGCHVNGVFQGTPDDCYSCHQKDDTHGGKYGTSCGSCHSTSAWKPATFDHNLSGFPLTGAHEGLGCSQCHSSGEYSGLSSACSSCHSEPSVHAGMYGTDCAQCHNTSNWNATFSHPGGCEGNCADHRGATCADCHPVNYSTATCVKCHNQTPGGGD